MTETENRSLCVVEKAARNGHQLKRLADVEDGRLVRRAEAPETEEWSMLYWDILKKYGGPSEECIGLWDWSAVPHYRDPGKLFVVTKFLPEERPVLILPVKASDAKELCTAALETGAAGDAADLKSMDIFFAYFEEAASAWMGTLCPAKDCSCREGKVFVREDWNPFQVYRVAASEVFVWENRGILLEGQLGTPVETVSMGDADSIIEACLQEALTWPYFKNHTGGNRLDWRTCKDLIQGLFRDSVTARVAKKLAIPKSEAEKLAAAWVERAAKDAEFGTEDAQLMAAVAMRSDRVRGECLRLASELWAADNEARVQKAEQEIQERTARINRLGEQEKNASKTLDGLKKKNTEARRILKELEGKIAEDKLLAENTGMAVQNRIQQARADVASFLGELSFYLPALQTTLQAPPAPASAPAPAPVPAAPEPKPAEKQPEVSSELEKSKTAAAKGPGAETQQSGERRIYIAPSARTGIHENARVRETEDWQDELDIVVQNLKTIVPNQFRYILAPFLYAAYLSDTPLLAVGPCGQLITDALSCAVSGTGSGRLMIEQGDYLEASEILAGCSSEVVSVQETCSMNAPNHTPCIPQHTSSFLMWLQPLPESLAGTPAGIFSYMLPLLTEPFLDGMRIPSFCLGKRTAKFRAELPMKDTPLFLKAFQQLNLSAFVFKQINLIFSMAGAMVSAKARDIELLCGLLPLCVALGRQDVLASVLSTETGLGKPAREAARRFL